MTDYTENFEQLATDAGMPTTEAEINAEFETLRDQEGLTVTNANAFGPFWRFVKAVATVPVKWLIDFVISYVLPQCFLVTATGVWLELHVAAVNISRKLASKAVGNIQFSRVDTTGELVIPAGVQIQSTSINGNVYTLISTQEVSFSDGQAAILVPVEAVSAGAAYNLSENYYTVLADNIDGVSVNNLTDWLTTPGADEETDTDLRNRAINQYSAINQWHTDAVYTSIIAGFDGVTTNNVYFEHDAPRGPGTANGYVMLESGTPSAEFIASIQSEITDNGNHGHGDDLVIYAMPETSHDIVCTVWPVDNLTAADTTTMLENVEDVIRCAFRENADFETTKTQPWDTFSFSLLGLEIHQQVANVKNITFDLTHIDSAMNVPRVGTLTVQTNA